MKFDFVITLLYNKVRLTLTWDVLKLIQLVLFLLIFLWLTLTWDVLKSGKFSSYATTTSD